MALIYLAGGCFWGIQGYFDKLNGVCNSIVGYANTLIANPSYELVCTGRSGAVEALELHYNEQILSLEEIVGRFLSIIDPCALNFQGNDVGSQYRNGIYFVNQSDECIIKDCLRAWEEAHQARAVTEILPLQNFYPAEAYHQKYLQKHPQGYCHIDIALALKPYKV